MILDVKIPISLKKAFFEFCHFCRLFLKFKIPVFAYQVSGEYSLLSNAISNKFVDNEIILESLISFKRAGANAIVSYYADRIDQILK